MRSLAATMDGNSMKGMMWMIAPAIISTESKVLWGVALAKFKVRSTRRCHGCAARLPRGDATFTLVHLTVADLCAPNNDAGWQTSSFRQRCEAFTPGCNIPATLELYTPSRLSLLSDDVAWKLEMGCQMEVREQNSAATPRRISH